MDNSAFTSYSIEDRSFLAFIKREIRSKVLHETFNSIKGGEIDIIVAELTSNIIKYAGSGELLYRFTRENDLSVFEVICIDNAKGISNVTHVMKDGVSTARTLGHGLGAIQRLSDLFQLYSLPDWGTVAYAKVLSKKPPPSRPAKKRVDIKALCIPKSGEEKCGDGFFIKRIKEQTHILFGDGLGHGEQAHAAVQKAGEVFHACEECDPVDILNALHKGVKRTRGLVAAVAVIDLENKTWRLCGVGNILSRIYNGTIYKNYMPYNGIVGLNMSGSMKSFELPVENNQQLVMCSDGIKTRWEFTKYAALYKYDLMISAAILYKDFSRRNDDASILVAKVAVQ